MLRNNVPWGERIWLAIGEANPWLRVTDFALLAILGLVASGCWRLWRRKLRRRALNFGAASLLFVLCFVTYASLIDTGRLDSPYLTTYGFLALGLICNDQQATLRIGDDGCGFDVAPKSAGMGLDLMRERIESIGGELQAHSELRSGTTVTVDWHRRALEQHDQSPW